MNKKTVSLVLITSCIFLISCSSQPKRTMKVTDIAKQSADRREQGNAFLTSGQFQLAESSFLDAYNLALSVNDFSLLAKIKFSQMSLLLTQNASLEEDAQNENHKKAGEYLREATVYANNTEDSELYLAICNLYKVYINLTFNNQENTNSISEIISFQKVLSKDPYYEAFSHLILAKIYRSQNKLFEAEEEYLLAAKIHEKNRYLFEIGNDWYLKAQMCSLQGKKEDAINDLTQALHFDKLAENTNCIASDYLALAIVLEKHGTTEEDKSNMLFYADQAKKIASANNLTQIINKADAILGN